MNEIVKFIAGSKEEIKIERKILPFDPIIPFISKLARY